MIIEFEVTVAVHEVGDRLAVALLGMDKKVKGLIGAILDLVPRPAKNI